MNSKLFYSLILSMPLILNAQVSIAENLNRPAVEGIAHACAGCHNSMGESLKGTPSINNMTKQSFIEALKDFKSGKSQASIMNRIAQALQDEDIEALALFFGR